MPRKVLIALPSAMLEYIDFIAQDEHRTRSDLIREALRRYMGAYERARITLAAPATNAPTAAYS